MIQAMQFILNTYLIYSDGIKISVWLKQFFQCYQQIAFINK